jgi:hypothetical protein
MAAQDLSQDRRKAARIVQVCHVVARKLDEIDAEASGEGLSGATVVVRAALVRPATRSFVNPYLQAFLS